MSDQTPKAECKLDGSVDVRVHLNSDNWRLPCCTMTRFMLASLHRVHSAALGKVHHKRVACNAAAAILKHTWSKWLRRRPQRTAQQLHFPRHLDLKEPHPACKLHRGNERLKWSCSRDASGIRFRGSLWVEGGVVLGADTEDIF